MMLSVVFFPHIVLITSYTLSAIRRYLIPRGHSNSYRVLEAFPGWRKEVAPNCHLQAVSCFIIRQLWDICHDFWSLVGSPSGEFDDVSRNLKERSVWRIPIHGIHCIEDSSCVSCLMQPRHHTPRHNRIKCRRCFVRRMWISSRIVETMLFATHAIVGRTESIACVLVRSDK